MAITKKQDGQCKKTAYAKTSQVKRIRRRMQEIMTNELADKSTKRILSVGYWLTNAETYSRKTS